VPEPFYIKQVSLPVRKKATVTLPVTFIPFEFGTHRCDILLTDKEVGEI